REHLLCRRWCCRRSVDREGDWRQEMTGPEIMAVVGFFVMLSGVLWGVWWKIDAQVKTARGEAMVRAEAAYALAALARQDVADLRLHTAEVYATKQGMHEQTSQLLRAIESVASRIDGLSERLDNILLQRPTTRRST
ncbi:hypothetical protein, partial [Shinella zoogloeoides]